MVDRERAQSTGGLGIVEQDLVSCYINRSTAMLLWHEVSCEALTGSGLSDIWLSTISQVCGQALVQF